MRNSFPHAAAWLVAAAMFGALAIGQWWQSCIAATHPVAQVQPPAVEIVPQDRPDRNRLDDSAFDDEMKGTTWPPLPARAATGRSSNQGHM